MEEIKKVNTRLKKKEQECNNRRYQSEGNRTCYVSEMLKQKVKAGGIEIKGYGESVFKTNQKLFYEILNKGMRNNNNDPNSAAVTKILEYHLAKRTEPQ